MNAVMGFASAAEQLQRVETIRRRNAESTYGRQTEFLEQSQKTKADLEALLRGEVPHKEAAQPKVDFQKLDAGQVRNIAIPLGNNLEETIDLWKDVRREAYSIAEPTTADYQLGSKASAKITEAELQLALHNRAKAIRELMSSSVSLTPTDGNRIQTHYKEAFNAYAVQNEARNNQYQIDFPQMNVSV
ncbi:hypothetical protein DV702_15805 [Sporosarcina sp. PTS2304]|nr:hypothetical protein DV702_15805 [Sporosarcina sp. PTS2304]